MKTFWLLNMKKKKTVIKRLKTVTLFILLTCLLTLPQKYKTLKLFQMWKIHRNPQFYLHLIPYSGTFWSPFNCIISILAVTLSISAITSVAKDMMNVNHAAYQLVSRVGCGPKCNTGIWEKPQSWAGEQTGGNRRNSWSKTEGCGSIQNRDEAGWSGTDEVGNRRSNSWSKTEGCGNIQDRDEAGWSGTDEVGNRGSVRGKTQGSQA